MRECVVGLDVGGSSMKGVVLARGDRRAEVARRPVPRGAAADVLVAAIGDVLDELVTQAVAAGLTTLACGVAVPGTVDESRGLAVYSANLGWRDLPVRDLLATRTGLPVAFGHDVRAAGLAEARWGAASDSEGAGCLLFVAVGTGIAGAVVLDGRVLSGDGYAGEIGHVRACGEDEPCPCGGRGCLETVASAASIARRYTSRTGRAVGGASDVARLVGEGDPDARAVWDAAVAHLADALTAAATLLAPHTIVVGGGLAEAGPLLLDPLRDGLSERLTFPRVPRVRTAALGEDAGCLGAALLAWRTVEKGSGEVSS